MSFDRILVGAGSGCVLVAGSILLVGTTDAPLLPIALLSSGTGLLALGLVRSRARPTAAHGPGASRADRLARIAFVTLGALGVVALLVGLIVGQGDARGHAIFHVITGAVTLGLFAVLAFA